MSSLTSVRWAPQRKSKERLEEKRERKEKYYEEVREHGGNKETVWEVGEMGWISGFCEEE